MLTLGIRELRQHASKYLRFVRDGETIQVTDRGEPIAMITPSVRPPDPLAQLRREGKIRGPERPLDLDAVVPLPTKPGIPLPSEVVQSERASSRF